MDFFKSTRFIYLTITFILFEILVRSFLWNVNFFIRVICFMSLAFLVDCFFRFFGKKPN
ncbi:hypothetical protein D920_01004 [Enterococcus faecalis 13-SD-W-01]|nr:hypothetical protein D920_01004 [Enterococcus faecalis 13-SD-W-01]